MTSRIKSAYASATQKYEDLLNQPNPLLSIPLPDFAHYFRLLKPPTLQSIRSSGLLSLQNLWAASHVVTILGTLTYVYALISNNNLLWKLSYRTSLAGTIVTYLVVLSRSNVLVAEEEVLNVDEQKSRVELVVETTRVPLSDLLKDENAQLLGYATLWLFTSKSFIKILPFNLYSLLNIASFITTQIYPDTTFSAVFTPCVNYIEVPLLMLASHLDVLVFAVLSKEGIELNNVYPLVIYGFIWLLRFETSEASRSSVNTIIRFLDYLCGLSSIHVYQFWGNIRQLVGFFIQLEKREPFKTETAGNFVSVESDSDEESENSDFLDYRKELNS